MLLRTVVPGVYRGVTVDCCDGGVSRCYCGLLCLGCIEVLLWTVVPGVYRGVTVDCCDGGVSKF